MKELVSVVVGTYNGEKYLRPQIESILKQSYKNIEVVVVDDASTDKTLSILNEYAALDNRIHVYPAEKNLGLIANFERGVRLAKGEFIALSDQDDVFRIDKIEMLADTLNAYPERDLVVSDLSLIDENGSVFADSKWSYQKMKPKQNHPFSLLVYQNFATGCAMMFRRRLLTLALPFPPNCLVHDWWLAVVSASESAGGICLLRETLTYYRQHQLNVIGVKNLAPLTIRKVIVRIMEGPKPGKGIDMRNASARSELSRLNGYLSLDIWSPHDRSFIEQYKLVLQRYLADEHSNIIERILCIPERLRYPIFARKSIREIVEVIYFSIFPFK